MQTTSYVSPGHGQGMFCIVLCTTLLVLVPLSQAIVSGDTVPPLEVAWKYYRLTVYRDAGSFHVGLRNASESRVRIQSIQVNGLPCWDRKGEAAEALAKRWAERGKPFIPATAKPGEVMWCWVTDDIVSPGQMTECIVKFFKRPLARVQIDIICEDGKILPLECVPTQCPMGISAVTFSKDLKNAYLYLANRSSKSIEIREAWLNGQQQRDGVSFVGRHIAPGQKGCVVIERSLPFPVGRRFYFMVSTSDNATIGCSIKPSSHFPVVEASKGVVKAQARFDSDDMGAWKAYVKEPYRRLDLVAQEIIANRNSSSYLPFGQMMYYWSNQAFIKTGTWAFGELVDGARLHLQPLETHYMGRYGPQDTHYVQAKMRFIRHALEPYPVFPQTEVGHGLMSSDYQSLLTPEEMRLRVYYMISRGAKGVLFRPGAQELAEKCTLEERLALERTICRLTEELLTMRQYLRIGEFIDGLAVTEEPLVEASALLCGNRALVIVLMNHDRQQSWPKEERYQGKSFYVEPKPDPFSVTVNVPRGFAPSLVLEVDGESTFEVPFEVEDGAIRIHADSIVTTRQYVILSRGVTSPKGWTTVPPVRRHDIRDEPDVQFAEKQYFWGSVPPGTRAAHRFGVRNAGNGPLQLSVASCPEGVYVFPPEGEIHPAGEGEVLMCFDVKGRRDHRTVWLETNDPNERRIRLEMGGYVRAPYNVSPQQILLTQRINENKAIASLHVVDESNGVLELGLPAVSSDSISVSHSMTEHVVTLGHAEVHRGQYSRRVNTYELVGVFDKEDDGREEWISIGTNSTWKPEIRVPIQVKVEPAITAVPSSALFGVIRQKMTREVNLKSPLGRVEVIDTSSQHSMVAATLAKKRDGTCLMISADVGKEQETLKGHITVRCRVAGQIEEARIPYFAITVPEAQ